MTAPVHKRGWRIEQKYIAPKKEKERELTRDQTRGEEKGRSRISSSFAASRKKLPLLAAGKGFLVKIHRAFDLRSLFSSIFDGNWRISRSFLRLKNTTAVYRGPHRKRGKRGGGGGTISIHKSRHATSREREREGRKMTQNPRVEMKPEQNIHIFLHKKNHDFLGHSGFVLSDARRRRFPELPACLLPFFLSSPIGCGNAAEEEAAAAAAAAVAAAVEKGEEKKPSKAKPGRRKFSCN